jgi:hypothetical protein
MRFQYYEAPGWFFRWDSPHWRIEPGPESGRFLIYTSRGEKTQVFELRRHHTKYGTGWTPIDLTGFWVNPEQMSAGAPVGAFLRELDTIKARSLPGLDKFTPHKTYDTHKQSYCSCLFYDPRIGCSVHTAKCSCDCSQLLAFGCKCGGI